MLQCTITILQTLGLLYYFFEFQIELFASKNSPLATVILHDINATNSSLILLRRR